jgi:hypothetical protein
MVVLVIRVHLCSSVFHRFFIWGETALRPLAHVSLTRHIFDASVVKRVEGNPE